MAGKAQEDPLAAALEFPLEFEAIEGGGNSRQGALEAVQQIGRGHLAIEQRHNADRRLTDHQGIGSKGLDPMLHQPRSHTAQANILVNIGGGVGLLIQAHQANDRHPHRHSIGKVSRGGQVAPRVM